MIISECADLLQYPSFLVGGIVRDLILQRTLKDVDIVCVGKGIILAEKSAQKLHPKPKVTVFKNFGTAMFRYDNVEFEFVGARKESYHHSSRNPIVEQGTLEDDQNRRDFTVNALAIQINEHSFGTLIDPFNGLQDIQDKIIRTPLDPKITFDDDPLRMLRAIRFAAQLEFSIEAETLQAITTYKERIKIISAERIATEINKILLTKKPSIGFKLLEETGLLRIILPELVALKGVEVKNNIGHKDNFYHTLQVLDNVAMDEGNGLWLRWAALLHDIGKAPTKKYIDGIGWTFHTHEFVGAKMVKHIFSRLKLPMHEPLRYVKKLVACHLRPISLTQENVTDSAIRRLLFDCGEDIDDLMILCRADITSKNEQKVDRFLKNYDMVARKLVEIEEKDKLRNWQPPISGNLIMQTFGLRPSKEVGIIKTEIREAILEGTISNNYDEAFNFMIDVGKKLGFDRQS